MIGEPEIARLLSGAANLDVAAQDLIDAANAAGGRDNITVVLFRVAPAPEPEPDVDQPTVISSAGGWLGVGGGTPSAGVAAGLAEGQSSESAGPEPSLLEVEPARLHRLQALGRTCPPGSCSRVRSSARSAGPAGCSRS